MAASFLKLLAFSIHSEMSHSVPAKYYNSAPHGDRCTAGCEACTNFLDQSACLMADNVPNEVKFLHLFTGHRRC
jgi:hypothetical protein